MMRAAMEAGKRLLQATALPGVRKVHPWVRPDKTSMRWLPINADIEMPEGTPLPLELLNRLIEEASRRVLFNYCGCRKSCSCRDYPVELGCLLMGDSALEAVGRAGHEVGVEEAKARAAEAVAAGLVPIVGKARLDNFFFGVKDRGRMITTCFCCPCCCVTRFLRWLPSEVVEPIFPRLEGVSLHVNEACRGCGKCAEQCYMGAISIEDGRAVIGERCRACGRCASACPQHAVTIAIDDPDFAEKAYRQIRAHVKHD